ncbi:MAG: hypothetical protein DI536_00665 [Archangium gephyra]|uniref:Tc toxin complex TcA C-terminal TcB-binding domain-containing protein n=1 Tax=Archangium gephyra TaxID=48 RepID=A0A2W5TWD8_9BACT|nr:MAG: hypothetical protein DI536_00665 [Archangium gephyra]
MKRLTLAMLALAACSKTTSNLASTAPVVPSSQLVLLDASGCLLDADCNPGLFCFQNRCTFECAADRPCATGETCSPNGRCLSDAKASLTWMGTGERAVAWDEAQAAAAPAEIPVAVRSPPPQQVEVTAGAPFVEVTLETSAALPDGALLYRVALEGAPGTPQSLRATGSTTFTLTVPTGTAGTLDATPTVQRANIVTSVGAFSLSLVPRRGVDGLYAGDVAVREFGGSAVPLQFGLRIVPADATFETAQERFLMLPASPQALFSPIASSTEVWVERPLEWDAQAEVWFARYAAPFALGGNSQFAKDGVVRTLRIELSGMEDGRLEGAVADRWLGLYATRSADGVPTPATVGLTGQLTATRVQPLPAAARTPVQGSGTAMAPSLGAPLAITQCTASVYSGLVNGTGGITDAGLPFGPCPGMSSPAAFSSAASEDKASCALALADKALSGPSTAAQVLAFLDENTPNPGNLAFTEFLTRCAARDGYCVPSPELLCAGQLLAHAYQTQGAELTQAGALLERYQRVAREGYLGRQLAAFQVDTTTRLEWLRTSEAPLFLASELKAYNEDILNRWKTQVLDAHFDVLRAQFAPAGLEVLGRQPTDPTALSVRGQMLLEQAQTWQGAMEALQIASTRWNSLYQDTASRGSATALVRSRMLDLYLSAAVLSQLNRASGASANSSIFGSGFAALLRSLEQLSLPFDSLIFMRDAEVVVNRSVDPSSSANTLLADRRELAARAVLDAQDSVDRVLDDARATEINAQVLTDRMITQAEELRSELVQICGLPRGCSTTDFAARPECAVNVNVGGCGFVRDPGGAVGSLDDIAAQPSISQAGQAILAFRQSLLEQQIAQEEFRANQERAQIELDAADAFARKIDAWDRQRRAVNTEVQALLDEMTALNLEAMATEIAELKGMQARRAAAYAVQEAAVKQWSAIRYAGVTADMKQMTSINALNQTGAWLTRSADEIDHVAATIADGYPKAVGLSNDVSFAGRFIIGMSTFGVTSGLRAAATALDTAAASVELSLTESQARRDAQLEELADLADLEVRATENELANMTNNLRIHALRTEAQVAQREALIDALRRNLELDLARDRDLVELRDRRDKVRLRLTDSTALQAAVARAEVVATRHLLEYFEVVQRAQLLQGRYAALSARLENLNELIASPAVIFAFANRLARAESRVERARTLLFDWLVALEYYAVRPFIDQRLAILLARNPSQLEAIANELVRLQNACGGNVNTAVAEVSLRDDLLEVGFDTQTMTRAERFREVLRRGNVPIDTRVRYSTDQRIGDLLRARKVLAATFTLSLDEFANLAQTCNAKVASLDVQLVGEGLGNARPTVSVLYDGTSTLRSCQPNIRELVSSLDPGTSSFGALTRFRTQGRSVSPVASINGFGRDDSANRGLEGLPLASTYTVLIDPEAGENAKVDWSRLDDVKLKVTWAYQDLFPVGQCQ